MKIGIYVDAVNINRNGGYSMKYDILKEYCGREGEVLRQNTYVTYDRERAEIDRDYREKQFGYYSILRSFGYKVLSKPTKWFMDEEGNKIPKSSSDIEISTDLMLETANLDKVYLLTGDGDFKKLVRAIQSRGVRVELIGFKNVSTELIFEADWFVSGYLIPNLVPVEGQQPEEWGQENSRVRGSVYAINDGFGFMRFLNLELEFEEVFFHFSEMPPLHRVRLDETMEFTLIQGDRGWQAKEVRPM